MMRALSALGDAGLLLPASVALLAFLAVRRAWAGAGALAVAIGACGAATIAAKLLFRACGASITDLDVVSPSGHASFATVFYGALAILLATGRPTGQRAVLAAGTLLLLLGIGVSRVWLGEHSTEEVILGYAIGGAATLLFAALHARVGRPTLPVAPLAFGFCVALALVGGRPFTLEGPIARTARHLSASLDICRGTPARNAAIPLGRDGR